MKKNCLNYYKRHLNAVESVKAASGKSDSEVLIGGLEKQLADLATASSQAGKNEAEVKKVKV